MKKEKQIKLTLKQTKKQTNKQTKIGRNQSDHKNLRPGVHVFAT